MNYLIILANVLIFIFAQHTRSDTPVIRMYMLRPDQPEVYQFFSCMFLHGDWMHLIGNMIFLWVFGNAVNDSMGTTGYLAFYLAGGIIAGLGYVLMSGSSPVLGASGAISGVTGAFLVLFPRVRVTVLVPLFFVLLPWEVSSLFFLLLQFAWNMYFSFAQAERGIAYVAHASGYVFGIAMAAGLLATKLLPRDVYDLLSLLRMWRRRHQYARVVAEGYDPFRYSASRPGAPLGVAAEPAPALPPAPAATPAELELRREIAADHARGDFAAAADKYLRLIQLADDVVLSLPQQWDIANYLMSRAQYPQAADAYERFLRSYHGYEYAGDARLMLGLIYSRYLHQDEQAFTYLTEAIPSLSDHRNKTLAANELAQVRKRLGR